MKYQHLRTVWLTISAVLIFPLTTFGAAPATVWRPTEINLTAQASYANPFTDVDVHCEFDGPNGERVVARGFYDGGRSWRVRFTPTAVGAWSYRTVAAD